MRHSRASDRRLRALAATVVGALLVACGPDDSASGSEKAAGTAAGADSATARSTVYRLVDVAPGVYATVVGEGVNPSQWATSLIVVRSDHVLVVDTRQHAAAAEELLETVAAVSDLPVRYVVNTHWHGDHVQGNAAFRTRYPDVRIIGGVTTAEDMRTLGRQRLGDEIERVDDRLAAGRRWLERGERDDGTPLTDEEKAALPGQIEAAEAYVEARRGLELLPPDLVVDSTLALTDAEPRVEIVRVGPAHTRGDVIVALPELRVAAIGDLIEDGFPWYGDGYPAGWAGALDRIGRLEVDVFLPGHGPVLRDREMFDVQRRFAHALVDEARRAVQAGLTREAARAAADFSQFEAHFTRRLAERPPQERHERFAAFIDETFARAFEEASGSVANP